MGLRAAEKKGDEVQRISRCSGNTILLGPMVMCTMVLKSWRIGTSGLGERRGDIVRDVEVVGTALGIFPMVLMPGIVDKLIANLKFECELCL